MLVANRAGVVAGRNYAQGEEVLAASLDPGKVQQLIARRILRDTEATSPASCILLRDLNIKGKAFKRGTKVGTTRLNPAKVSQMLDHRILGPA